MKTLFTVTRAVLLVIVGVISCLSLLSASAHALDDATIFAIFDEVNAADISTARLGAKKGRAPEVRELARSVASDHEQVQQTMRELARKLAISPIPPDNDTSAQDQARAIADMQDKSGTDFDRAYLLHEIEFHSAAIKAVKQTLLPTIQNHELRALVQNILPGLEHHLTATVETARKLGYK